MTDASNQRRDRFVLAVQKLAEDWVKEPGRFGELGPYMREILANMPGPYCPGSGRMPEGIEVHYAPSAHCPVCRRVVGRRGPYRSGPLRAHQAQAVSG